LLQTQNFIRQPGNKELFTSAGNRQALAVAGKDRNVYIYDPRKWAVRSVWKSALKHEVRFILLIIVINSLL
jgi:hypothetical protein